MLEFSVGGHNIVVPTKGKSINGAPYVELGSREREYKQKRAYIIVISTLGVIVVVFEITSWIIYFRHRDS